MRAALIKSKIWQSKARREGKEGKEGKIGKVG